jgi:predicted transcriptional regulator of viral defense system
MTSLPSTRPLPAVFTRADTSRLGISKRQLYAWRDEGVILPLGGGLFLKAGTSGDPDLIEVAARTPGAALCLTSALARHDLSDEIPEAVHVAIERGRRPPRTTAPVIWHHFDEATFAVGRQKFRVIDDRALGIYSPIRTIIDSFRLRHLGGQDVAIEALRRWLRQRGSQPSDLLAMVRHFPAAEKSIRAALEILL